MLIKFLVKNHSGKDIQITRSKMKLEKTTGVGY